MSHLVIRTSSMGDVIMTVPLLRFLFRMGDCRRGDLACLEWLTPEMVLKKILNKLKKEDK